MAFDWRPFFTSTQRLIDHAEGVFGLYHDSLQGMWRFHDMVEGIVAGEVESGLSREQALGFTLAHGDGDPQPQNLLHFSTLGETLERTRHGGTNELVLGQMCLVSIYAFWEVRTRNELAEVLGISLDGVRSDLFGDIRLLRHMLLHRAGKADGSANRLKILKWCSPGELIVVDRPRLREVINRIRDFPDGLHTPGFDPHR
ncbi:MAG: hypothetical protein GXC75_13210 [Xanthomonadaceae bacterium]|nr:hypothetical protein [Xanthomonadaceae bacterium]